MNLRDAKAQVEREQPHLTGTAKLEAIKALRKQPAPAATEPREPAPQEEKPAPRAKRIRDAWAGLVLVVVGMRLIGYLVWGSVYNEPHWYDVLYVVLLIGMIADLVSAYRGRSRT